MRKYIFRRQHLFFVLFFCALVIFFGGYNKKLNQKSEKAMGRYVEKEIKIPEGINDICSLEMINEKEIWMATRGNNGDIIYSSKNKGRNWDIVCDISNIIPDLDRKLIPENGLGMRIQSIIIDQDQELLVSAMDYSDFENSEHITSYLWYVDRKGMVKLILGGIDSRKSNYIRDLCFDDKGNILVNIASMGVLHISAENGEILNVYEKNAEKYGMSVVGNILIVVIKESGTIQIRYFDLETGKPIEDDSILTSYITKSSNWSFGLPVKIVQDINSEKLFMCDTQGIYSCNLHGNIIEEIVNGSFSSLGDSQAIKLAFTKAEDDTFYVAQSRPLLANAYDPQISLYCYDYISNIPTTPDKELKIYALDKYDELSQAAFLYQTEHPEVRIIIETAFDDFPDNSSSSASYRNESRTDKLKVLNTEILAGKGPDLLILDQMPIQKYIEKGILSDISDTLNNELKILPNILNAYKNENGDIYGLPTRIRIPAIFGDRHSLKEGMSMEQIKKTILSLKQQVKGKQTVYPYFTQDELIEFFLNISVLEFQNSDGTMIEAKLRDFLEQLICIYRQEAGELNANRGEFGSGSPYEKGIGLSLVPVFMHQSNITFGEICSPAVLELMESMIEEDNNLAWEPLGNKILIPCMTIGVCSNSKNKEEAKDFVKYLFGKEAQSIQQGNGFSVCDDVLKTDDYWGGLQDDEIQSYFESILFSNPVTMADEKTLKLYSLTPIKKQKIYSLFQKFDNQSNLDIQIKLLIINEIKSLMSKHKNIDQAMESLMNRINIYVSE